MKILATNRRAHYDYDVLQRFEAGIVLSGPEVKSIKSGHINLKGSYISLKEEEAFLVNAHIAPYLQATDNKNYIPTQKRKLLLHKKEIIHIINICKSQRLSVIPLKIGLIRGKIKIEIALARGKRKHDKREDKKRRAMLKDVRLENQF